MRRLSFLRLLERVPRHLAIPLGLVLQGAVGLLDYRAGYHMSLSLFYLIPICLVAARTGRRGGLVMSVLGAAVLFAVEFSLRPQELGILVLVWNVVLRWGFFVLVVLALTELQDFLKREAALSRSDPTTGLANSRSFVEVLEAEIARLRRYPCPFSIAYLDVDNFKRVNDQHGHTAGDQLLLRIAGALKDGVRATDHVARLGGDEFAILLPETVQPEARSLLDRLQRSVELLTQGQGWPVTVSIGLVTFNQAPKSAEEVIMAADDLMYAVKREGKAGIREKSLP